MLLSKNDRHCRQSSQIRGARADQPPAVPRRLPLPAGGPPAGLADAPGGARPAGIPQAQEQTSLSELVHTPELAAEVTLQPIRRFDFDAAILFSDILVVAEGLGQGYKFRDGGGIEMEFALRTADDIEQLDVPALPERLAYVPRALQLVKSSLGDRTALIGFAGSPWTLANFMLEGGSANEYTQAKKLFYSEPEIFSMLMKKLTAAVTRLLQMQILAGADAVQIFDSLGGLLSGNAFAAASASWIKQIISALKGTVPVIVFSKDVTATGTSWWPPARRCWGWTGRCGWRTCAPNCRNTLACRAISIQLCS